MQRKSSGRIGNGLVALSSTAVLAVYAAGYARTKPAADRFDEQLEARAQIHVAAVTPAVNPPVAALAVPEAAPTPAPVAAKVAAKVVAHPAKTYTAIASAVVVDAPPPPTVAPETDAPAALPTAPVSTPAAAPTDLAALTNAAMPAAPAPAPDAAAAPAKRGTYAKDGTFTGWGSSRHGDIQAAVVVQDGFIVSAKITQCLTRYSCSWIARLPGQVVSRQSAEVDYVSGATQSTQAFYMAIVQALTQAK